MSWMPEFYIGEFRPWPDSVYIVRGNTDEFRRYMPDDFCAVSRENNELRSENNKLRKLCVELWCSCPVSDDGCVYCEHGGPKGTVDCDLWDTMHQLFEEVRGGE